MLYKNSKKAEELPSKSYRDFMTILVEGYELSAFDLSKTQKGLVSTRSLKWEDILLLETESMPEHWGGGPGLPWSTGGYNPPFRTTSGCRTNACRRNDADFD